MPSRSKPTKAPKTPPPAAPRAAEASATPETTAEAPADTVAPEPRVGIEVVRSRLRDAALASGVSLAPEVVVPAISHPSAPPPAEAPAKAPKTRR